MTAMNPTVAPPDRRRSRGRWQLLAIVAVVLGPMLLASSMYRFGFWVPQTRTFDGVLIGNGQGRAELGIQAPADPHWQLLVTAPAGCAEDCRQLVYLARQIHVGLGREVTRAAHALALAEPLDEGYEAKLAAEYPQLKRYPLEPQVYRRSGLAPVEPQLWIVDPHGNLVLRYDARTPGKAILEDLRHLLKLSQIG